MAVLLALTAVLQGWEAWQRLQTGYQTADVVRASGDLFKALTNLRLDRARTGYILTGASVATAEQTADVNKIRGVQMPALRSALATMHRVPFRESATSLERLDRLTGALARLHGEATEAGTKAKADRRPTLADEFEKVTSDLLKELESAGRAFTAVALGQDPFIDRMMVLKQMLWSVRSLGGTGSLIVSKAVGSGSVDDETRRRYPRVVGGMAAAWTAVEEAANDDDMPPALARALDDVKTSYVGKEYADVRDRLFAAVAAGEKPEMTQAQWLAFNSPRQDTAVAAAVAAIDAAVERADASNQAAMRQLVLAGVLVLVVVGVVVASVIVINVRVVAPLGAIADAMRRLASGDLSVEAAGASRKDEIGALADALVTFRANALEKARIEAEQQDAHAQRDRRAAEMGRAIATFEEQISSMLEAVLSASSHLNGTADEMTVIASDSARRAADVAASSQQASANVQTVAAASEELARSIEEIGFQVTTSREIARGAVEQAEATNGTVAGLVDASAKVGEIVVLINSIAAQTNLLALNATIEAARAGEAGKGFAVVAQEVKNLAAQTSRATDQIAQQIQAMQAISGNAAEAIKGIGGTILRIEEISTAIAAAVEEQNAATAEIARNVDQAAKGTERVSGTISDVTAAADQTGTAAHRVLDASGNVASLAGRIRDRVSGFLAEMRAA